MILIGFSGSWRHGISLAVLLCLFPFTTTHSACWEIAMPGMTVTATDLWQIRNRISGEATLLGESENERHAVSVDRIKSFSIAKDGKSGWLSGNRNAVEMKIRLTDDQTIAMVSEMNLYYIANGKRHTVPLGDVISATRCAGEPTAVPQSPERINPKRSGPVLVMQNGDILYGEVTGDTLRWQTSYARVGFKPAEIKLIKTGCEAASTGILETVAGDRLNGNLIDVTISFHLTTGQIMDIPTDQIRMIDFTGTQVADPITAKECNQDH